MRTNNNVTGRVDPNQAKVNQSTSHQWSSKVAEIYFEIRLKWMIEPKMWPLQNAHLMRSMCGIAFISLGIRFISNHWTLQHEDKSVVFASISRPREPTWKSPPYSPKGMKNSKSPGLRNRPASYVFIHWKCWRTISPMRQNSRSWPVASLHHVSSRGIPVAVFMQTSPISMERPSYGQGALALPSLRKLRIL